MAGPSSGNGGGFLSPISPYVLQEMQMNDDDGATPGVGGVGAGALEDTEDLKDKWGFTPGAEDTMDASHGGCLRGTWVW